MFRKHRDGQSGEMRNNRIPLLGTPMLSKTSLSLSLIIYERIDSRHSLFLHLRNLRPKTSAAFWSGATRGWSTRDGSSGQPRTVPVAGIRAVPTTADAKTGEGVCLMFSVVEHR